LRRQRKCSKISHMSDEQEVKSTAPDFNRLELDILKFWQEHDTFHKSLEKNTGNAPYIFYDGPPFATGLPHYGHMLASIIKDLVGRYQTMQGKYVRRRWGWDCHGLPIENIVEQHLKISGKKQIEEVGVERFNQVCRDNVLSYVKEWGRMVDRMGRWVDFDNSYKTMDTTYMESVWWALRQVWDKGLIYEDRKVLLYCSRCETPLSNFEVAMDNSYRDVTEESVYVKFKLTPKQRIVDFIADEKTYVLAWTTTPWTLPGNTALNVGPDIKYVIVEQNGEHYLLAKDRLAILDGDYEIKLECGARSLEGLSYEPLYPGVITDPDTRAHKIYVADFVTTTDGTGIVHNAAMYGEEDYQLAKEKNLPRMDMLDHKGQYLDMAPENLRGLFFKDADKVVIAELQNKGLMYKTEHYTHSYPYCWRCGTPLFYSALPAWFINIQKIKPQLLQHNEEISWFPSHLKHGRFAKSVEAAPDWNISRNRYWATALPFWKCENNECTNVVCLGSIAELRDQSTNFAEVYPEFDSRVKNLGWDNLKHEDYEQLDLHKPYIDRVKLRCDKCQSLMQRIPEVVDCWVESGSMPFAELHAPFENQQLFDDRYPADFVAEYIAQTRAWFYVMHVMGVMLKDKAPFKNVVTTGNILAEDGSKMSKSKNNFPDPWIVIDKYGVDAIRFYLVTSPVMTGEDFNFSEKGVSEVSRKLNMMLYNVWSFYRTYTQDKLSGEAPQATHVLDRWIMAMLNNAHGSVTGALDSYNTPQAGRIILDFINDLSTWYLRRSRDRIKAGGEDAREAIATLGYVLASTAKMLAPFTPFLADYLYKDITGKESVHLEDWEQIKAPDTGVIEVMEYVRSLVEAVLRARKEHNIKVRQPLAELQCVLPGDMTLDKELEEILVQELNVKKITPVNQTLVRPGWVAIGDSLALDTNLTSELKQEGLARELERTIQDLRKKSGLKVGELVDVYYNTQDEELASALVDLVDRKKTFVNQIQMSYEVEVDYETQAEVNKKAIWLGISQI
jgi:isoleucyl-tRNA synthetase